jgi:hypothetical protein
MKAVFVTVGLFCIVASCCMATVYMEPSDAGNSTEYITRGIINATKH